MSHPFLGRRWDTYSSWDRAPDWSGIPRSRDSCLVSCSGPRVQEAESERAGSMCRTRTDGLAFCSAGPSSLPIDRLGRATVASLLDGRGRSTDGRLASGSGFRPWETGGVRPERDMLGSPGTVNGLAMGPRWLRVDGVKRRSGEGRSPARTVSLRDLRHLVFEAVAGVRGRRECLVPAIRTNFLSRPLTWTPGSRDAISALIALERLSPAPIGGTLRRLCGGMVRRV